jgi:hypothetical protein
MHTAAAAAAAAVQQNWVCRYSWSKHLGFVSYSLSLFVSLDKAVFLMESELFRKCVFEGTSFDSLASFMLWFRNSCRDRPVCRVKKSCVFLVARWDWLDTCLFVHRRKN